MFTLRTKSTHCKIRASKKRPENFLYAGDQVVPVDADAAQADAAVDSGGSAVEARQEPSTAAGSGTAPDAPQDAPPDSPPFVQRPTLLDELLESDEVLQESEIEKRLLMINKRMPKCVPECHTRHMICLTTTNSGIVCRHSTYNAYQYDILEDDQCRHMYAVILLNTTIFGTIVPSAY